ncbi:MULTISPECIES: GTPase domain-containing protein [Dermacoccus]|uniref:G domain-containing protein n=2 Tax=Dermacoccus TaxID=57495 RepID=A0A417Z4C7_9MICO|nr:GTPase domain-containing protein [Dermacoccus abyssi]RHW45544.1 hypothetical protein D1832_09185 [Dermacoccus abyssi]
MNTIGKAVSGSGKAAIGTSIAGSALTAVSTAPEKLSTLLHRRYPTVGVTGMTGVGKTRLVDRLARRTTAEGVTEVGSATMERRTSKSARLKGFRFRVVPGDNAATRLTALDEVFYEAPVDGVIHVVAYGHATPRRSGGVSGAAPERTVEEQLAAELEDWTITAHRIAAMAVRRERPVWVVVAVTKADLYPERLDEAVRYYSPGSGSPFAAKLDELRALAGGAKISIDVLPVSAENSKELDSLLATLEARMAQLSGHV